MSIYDKASLVQIPSGVKSGTLYNVVPNTANGILMLQEVLVRHE